MICPRDSVSSLFHFRCLYCMYVSNFTFVTGDIGMEDEDGYLFVVDRLKELIKYKGFQVAPATLEDILLNHNAVADVGVIGVPDEDVGELPRAYVVKKADQNITEQDLVAYVEGKMFLHVVLNKDVFARRT